MGRKIKSFKEFSNIVDKVFEQNAVNYQQDFTTEIGGDIAMLTPIDTGKATGNWKGSVNSPDLSSRNVFDQSVSANPTKKAIESDISGSKFGDTLYISNGVKGEEGEGYIIGLENGKSRQAPHGMVLINIARAEAISKRALKS